MSLGFIRSAIAAVFALLVATSPAWPGDAAARHVLGFSPDGTAFAFEQYSTLYDSTEHVAEILVIDTRSDTFVKGTPFTVRTRDDDEREIDAVLADLKAKAKPLLDRMKVGEAGTRMPGAPSMDLDEIGIYQMGPGPLAKSQAIALPDGRKATLAIKETALSKASCFGAGGRATFGDVIVTGLTLTLAFDGADPLVLQADKRLPKNRRCVTEYGIAEAYLHRAADGTQTLAVMIETVDAHEFHAGPNRRFMAVTKRLPN